MAQQKRTFGDIPTWLIAAVWSAAAIGFLLMTIGSWTVLGSLDTEALSPVQYSAP